jgi:serine/threonine-protein kinase
MMSIECPKCHSDNPDDTIYCGKCATPLKPTEDIPARTETIEAPREELTTGSTFAVRYQIIEELGKGGMGRVYKATDTKIKEKIALKLIKPEIAKDKKTIERFSNELRLARKIRHKNVCGMFDLGEEKGTHYITMEFVPGEDLRSSIRRFGQLPIGKSISITKQICEGLAEAHRLGVIHRDLKSSNIMIDKEGNVRIMDFELTRGLIYILLVLSCMKWLPAEFLSKAILPFPSVLNKRARFLSPQRRSMIRYLMISIM